MQLSYISTHSLTKRLTLYHIAKRKWQTISTHSLTKRLTVLSWIFYAIIFISTHSLTKRLTIRVFPEPFVLEYFNSQPHEEADFRIIICVNFYIYFNSQPHEEADVIAYMGKVRMEIFQLTASRRGWHWDTVTEFAGKVISTHSLTKRLTTERTASREKMVFQLTASRRGWRLKDVAELLEEIFQLTASRRGWRQF